MMTRASTKRMRQDSPSSESRETQAISSMEEYTTLSAETTSSSVTISHVSESPVAESNGPSDQSNDLFRERTDSSSSADTVISTGQRDLDNTVSSIPCAQRPNLLLDSDLSANSNVLESTPVANLLEMENENWQDIDVDIQSGTGINMSNLNEEDVSSLNDIFKGQSNIQKTILKKAYPLGTISESRNLQNGANPRRGLEECLTRSAPHHRRQSLSESNPQQFASFMSTFERRDEN